MIATTLPIRRIARAAAGAHNTCPVLVVDGSAAPALAGESYHWVTPGAPVRYPNAYRRAWGKPVYVASTLRVEVGLEWLATAGVEITIANDTLSQAA